MCIRDSCKGFNLLQDIAAARVLFGTGLPLVQCPANGVTNTLAVTGPELEYWLRGKNPLCDYLCDVTEKEAAIYHQEGCWSRIIWDVAPDVYKRQEEGRSPGAENAKGHPNLPDDRRWWSSAP